MTSSFSPLKNRRLQSRQAQAVQQFLVFQLRQATFALSVEAVQKVTLLGQVFGDSQQSDVSLTLYENQELLVIDVGQRIFRGQESTTGSLVSNPSSSRFLLIVQDSQGQLVGLPVDSKPVMRQFLTSAVAPLPATYVTAANIQCVSSLMIQTQEQQPIFLIDPDQLSRG
jgi:chemotaxis signal transduction protein